MATVLINFGARLAQLEREQQEVDRELGLARLAVERNEAGAAARLQSARDRADTIRREMVEIGQASGQQQVEADHATAAAEERRRQADASAFRKLLSDLPARGARIDKLLADLSAEIVDLRTMQADVRQLLLEWVDEPNEQRKSDRCAGIERVLGFGAIETSLEAHATLAGMRTGNIGEARRLAASIELLLEDRCSQALEASNREFGAKSEAA